MQVSVGDRIIIKPHHAGEPSRDCVVVEIHGSDGQPPYVVRWADSGHDTLFFPGPDATVHHFEHAPK